MRIDRFNINQLTAGGMKPWTPPYKGENQVSGPFKGTVTQLTRCTALRPRQYTYLQTPNTPPFPTTTYFVANTRESVYLIPTYLPNLCQKYTKERSLLLFKIVNCVLRVSDVRSCPPFRSRV